MEAVLLLLIFYKAAVSLVVNVFKDLAQCGAEVLGRDVFIRAPAKIGDFNLAPVGQIERGSVTVR